MNNAANNTATETPTFDAVCEWLRTNPENAEIWLAQNADDYSDADHETFREVLSETKMEALWA